jgi:MFS superfamily sulfate permease-like transporter
MIKTSIKNRFGLSEWSGAVGDLGTLLPLAFALVVYNGYPASRILLLFGIVYVITGWIFKVPVSVQPLKVMAVIALAHGFSIDFIATTAFFYGILLILLSMTGIISWLQKWISLALIRGIQLGIGLILAQKAIELVLDKGLLLDAPNTGLMFNICLFLLALSVIWYFQYKTKFPIVLILIALSIPIVLFTYEFRTDFLSNTPLLEFNLPDTSLLLNGFIYLMIPQLPLTLGNAVFAASDSCHSVWGNQAERVSPFRLGLSIGISDLFIGLFSGFPVCHGAGGIAAHAQFGGKTGGTTIIIGMILIFIAVFKPFTAILFLIPVPILGAMLLFDSWRMIILFKKNTVKIEIAIALIVGIISFLSRHLALAIVFGIILESGIKIYDVYQKRKTVEAKGYEE